MHIYFSGIGGAGIGPLALVALKAGHQVSGSDKQDSSYIDYLKSHGVSDIYLDQSRATIAKVHETKPIDWLVYSSALTLEQPDAEELAYCRDQGIKFSKRDELLNQLLNEHHLKLIAIAGTHGKTTTTALCVWLLKQVGLTISYLLPAKTSFAEMGDYDPSSEYFVYEADEFDRNFLAYRPYLSLISGVAYDHHEIFPTRDDYIQAFKDFISQSQHTHIWQSDTSYLGLEPNTPGLVILDENHLHIQSIKLFGRYNRLDAWMAIQATYSLTQKPIEDLIAIVNQFPGLSRRLEEIAPGVFSDYAHTPEKIRGGLSAALELAQEAQAEAPDKHSGKVIIVYEPLTDRRQHYIKDDYQDCFNGAAQVYWLPSYLAREDPSQEILSPQELISHLSNPGLATAANKDAELKDTIMKHLSQGDTVVGMAGGGGGSLDDWLRSQFG